MNMKRLIEYTMVGLFGLVFVNVVLPQGVQPMTDAEGGSLFTLFVVLGIIRAIIYFAEWARRTTDAL